MRVCKGYYEFITCMVEFLVECWCMHQVFFLIDTESLIDQ